MSIIVPHFFSAINEVCFDCSRFLIYFLVNFVTLLYIDIWHVLRNCPQAQYKLSILQGCIKYFQYLNYKLHFWKYFNYYCQFLWTSSPKHKILLMMVVIEIQTTSRSHCELINQSIIIRLIYKRNIKLNISRLGIGTVTATVQCTVNKNKHWKYWLKHNT